jgi:hypothetical protein
MHTKIGIIIANLSRAGVQDLERSDLTVCVNTWDILASLERKRDAPKALDKLNAILLVAINQLSYFCPGDCLALRILGVGPEHGEWPKKCVDNPLFSKDLNSCVALPGSLDGWMSQTAQRSSA